MLWENVVLLIRSIFEEEDALREMRRERERRSFRLKGR
jgi:heme exporter protein D